ncbi:DNA circularization N-terminal domain-containing protein [Pseudomonas chlororaphis]|uniref:DNA circularization protein n=1 Tax=Pseudomonas chlororaphis TaxID=587753 RepID=UPI00209B5A1F|nr:DNA circularization N-terminal domain-containing protein [Pseudomonas chlororaphis]MCO7569366.1 DNA circularization N-terminal domain-containing protein [Pseudomonas chlororaphis]MCO7586789.1 DNA circularization N-terminal domain-containing protein [Pseudomonas chlororaphis]
MSLLADIIQIAQESNRTWTEMLNKASFRGVPFAVYGGDARYGRRLALHEYPGRGKPYIEDMGRSTRRIRMSGFLVTDSLVYGGGNVLAQRDALVAAAEKAGPGALMHPTLGALTVSIPAEGLSVIERWDMGRYFEISIIFIESGDRVFPTITTSTGTLLDKLAAALGLSAALDFARKVIGGVTAVINAVEGVIKFGKAIVGMVVGVIADFKVLVGRITRDVRSITSLGGLLTGDHGRYANGNISSALIRSKKDRSSSATMADLIAKNTSNRAAVDGAMDALVAAAENLDASSGAVFTDAVQSLMDALVAGIADPGNAIEMLGPLATFTPDAFSGSGVIGVARGVAQDATSALLRRTALAAIGKSVAAYVPASYDEAISTMGVVTGFIDAELLVAGDAGDDESYNALVAMRQAVVNDLTTTGATLPRLETFSFRAPMNALSMSNRLYRDSARADELIQQASPIHPAFMPTKVIALAK